MDFNIITVTVNPCLDVSISLEEFDFKEPNKSNNEMVEAGGKGINVSKVLTELNVDNVAIGFAGKNNFDFFESQLNKLKVKNDFILVDGKIRENLTIVSDDNKLLKINRQGFEVAQNNLEQLERLILCNYKKNIKNIIIFAGSLPKGLNYEQYKNFILKIKKYGFEIVLDSDLFSFDDLMEINPFIIKPNLAELSKMVGHSLTVEEAEKLAKGISNYTKHVLVSLGRDGLIYAGGYKIIKSNSPDVKVKSTVGAGDTTLAGFISRVCYGDNIENCIKYASACGCASVALEGTGIIKKQMIDEILPNVILEY